MEIRLRRGSSRAGGSLEENALAASEKLLREAHLEQTKIDLWGLFDGRGFPRSLVGACVERWGARAAWRVRKNPFTLLVDSMPGCGFKRTDKLYLDLGGDPTALKRQMLAAWDAIRNDSDGSTWASQGIAVRGVRQAVPNCPKAEEAIALGIRSGWLAVRADAGGKEWIAEGQKAQNELMLSEHIRRVRRGRLPPGPLLGQCLSEVPLKHVYFFRHPQNGLLKIGFTTRHVDSRREEVARREHGRADDLLLAGRIPSACPFTREQELHARFASLRRHGAWFAPGPELLSYLQEVNGQYADRASSAAEAAHALWLSQLTAGWAHHCRGPAAADLDPRLSPHQRQTVRPILTAHVAILAGTPGTGKTFVAAAIARALLGRFGTTAIAVCAPTGKASVRITSAMRRYGITELEAATIHRRLGITRNGHDGKGWGFARDFRNPLPQLFVIVDEGSMLDTDLAEDLFAALGPNAHILLIGDPYQLPPVGHGAPLRDMIAAGVPCGLLTEIKRQDGEANLIVKACAAIKDGQPFEVAAKFDPATGANLRFIEAATAEQAVEALKSVLGRFKGSGRFDPAWETQVLVALNEKSPVSRVELNKLLQGMLNPPAEGDNPAQQKYRVGDKIICLKNCWLQAVRLPPHRNDPESARGVRNYEDVRGFFHDDGQGGDSDGDGEDDGDDFSSSGDLPTPRQVYLANGEVGRVEAAEPKVIIARFFDPERLVRIPLGGASKKEGEGEEEAATPRATENGDRAGGGTDFDLGYAITTHKGQGSEWRCAIVMVDGAAGLVASREHIYTSISRASELCIMIGRRAVADRQAKRVNLHRRKAFLKELLQGANAEAGKP